jgi:signal transduction histidine kinase
VRTKLLAVLLIPAVAAIILGGLQVSTALQGVQDLGRTVRQVELGVRVSDLVHELQRERELMSGFVATNRTGDKAALDVQKRRVDGLASSVRAAGAQLTGLDDLIQSAYGQTVSSLNALSPLREVAETTQYSDQAVITSYSAMINTLLDLRREVARATNNREVAEIAGAADALGRAKEQVAQQHAILLVASLHDTLPPNDIQSVRVADSQYRAATSEFFSVANPVERQRFSDTVTGPMVDLRERIKQGAVQAAVSNQPPGINLGEWDESAGTTADLINSVEQGLNSQVRTSALSLREEAGADVVRDATILLGALFATLLLVVVVARSMLVPLRTLRDTAFDVADRRLPDAIRRIRDTDDVPDIAVAPVAVHTREEIGQVARAFDAVHGEAVRLAAEQSLLRRNVNDMFVNLSRRSQGLVERQLRLIDQLENSEQDPEQLSNLFQLDHLATRMRRNSENLLVLAGAELARRSTRPVPAVDVLRAAVSEVEDYQRVVVQTPPPVNVLGIAVNDLVHLVAELLDNATTYSPPDSRVVLTSSLNSHGDLVIDITDRGVGMPWDQLVDFNQRLTEPPAIDVSVSRRMGLFVVGRLASRHGVGVRLAANDAGEPGITATVTVPADLIQAGELTDFGPRTDSVPVPRTGGTDLSDMATTNVLSDQPSWQAAMRDDWSEAPANWPATHEEVVRRDAEVEPRPYAPDETPMQVSMVDPVSASDLFTPVAVPNIREAEPAPDWDPAPYDYNGVNYEQPYEQSYEQSYGDYGHEPAYESPAPRMWPDTDQDMGHAYPTTVTSRPSEDHLGVGRQPAPVASSETTPIYEEMVSAWFRELSPPTPAAVRPAPSYVEPPPFELPPARPAQRPANEAQAQRPAPPAPQREHQQPPSRPHHQPAPELDPVTLAGGRHSAARPSDGRTVRDGRDQYSQPAEYAGATAARPNFGADYASVEHGPGNEGNGSDNRSDNGDVWRSPADEGWLAASALGSNASNDFTAAGLPKRRRGANLVPGSAGQLAPAAPAGPRRARNADDVRGRLASYQQGLRQGRDLRRDLAHASLDPGSEHSAPHSTNEESQ